MRDAPKLLHSALYQVGLSYAVRDPRTQFRSILMHAKQGTYFLESLCVSRNFTTEYKSLGILDYNKTSNIELSVGAALNNNGRSTAW